LARHALKDSAGGSSEPRRLGNQLNRLPAAPADATIDELDTFKHRHQTLGFSLTLIEQLLKKKICRHRE